MKIIRRMNITLDDETAKMIDEFKKDNNLKNLDNAITEMVRIVRKNNLKVIK